MICHYFSFLIVEIWLARQDSILLGIILFSILVKHKSDLQDMGLPNYPRPAFEPSVLGFRFGLMQRGMDITWGAPLLWAWRAGLRANFYSPINYYYLYFYLFYSYSHTSFYCPPH